MSNTKSKSLGNTESSIISRVPEITLIFWIIKILSTTVGETGADFLSETIGLGLLITTIIMGVALIVATVIKFKIARYTPIAYWSVVVLMSIEGTLITDYLVDELGVTLVTTFIIFSFAMIAGFIVWYKREKTLSIHSITTAVREKYYWLIIILAFALGTAGGDLVSEKLELGYGVALGIFGGLIAVIAYLYYTKKLSATISFWITFILTRPLGASLGDLLTQTPENGGFGVSTVVANSVFFSVIIFLIAYLIYQQKNSDSLKIS